MKKKVFIRVVLLLMVEFVVLTFVGCDTLLEVLAGTSSSSSNDYSSSSESGLYYNFYNYSSYTVTLTDATGEVTLYSGGSCSANFKREATIYNVYYSPSDKVKVSQSGTTFTFRDR